MSVTQTASSAFAGARSRLPSPSMPERRHESRAQLTARMMVQVVIALAIGVILLQTILVPFLNDLAGVNTSNLTGNQQTLVDLLPTIIALGVVLVVIGAAVRQAF